MHCHKQERVKHAKSYTGKREACTVIHRKERSMYSHAAKSRKGRERRQVMLLAEAFVAVLRVNDPPHACREEPRAEASAVTTSDLRCLRPAWTSIADWSFMIASRFSDGIPATLQVPFVSRTRPSRVLIVDGVRSWR